MTIDELHKIIDGYLRKSQNGFLSPEEKDRAINRAQIAVFEEYKSVYAVNQQVQDALLPFKSEYQFNNATSTNGIVTIPSGYVHLLSIETVVSDSNGIHYVPVEMMGEDKVSQRRSSVLIPNNSYNPIAVLKPPALPYGQYRIQIYPATATAGTVYYLRKPAPVLFAYTQVNGRPVYNGGASIHPEWNEPAMERIIYKAIQWLGLEIQDVQAIQFAQSKEVQGGK